MSTNSGAEWSATTIQYQLNLSRALHSISPALSALHASRAAALHPEASAILHHSHCPKCGTYRFSCDRPTHPSTMKKRRRAITFQKSCHLCGFSTDARNSRSLSYSSLPNQLLGSSSKSKTIPPIPRTRETGQESSVGILHLGVEPSPTTIPAPVPLLPGQRSHLKSSDTKTSALKDMLSRDRQREVANARKKRKESREGLAAFLKEL